MLIDLLQLKTLIGVPHQTVDGYLVCYKNNKKNLFDWLESTGFFQFHVTNKGYVVGVHQIVAFATYGYKALANGFTAKFGEIEVHHINGNPLDNSPDNLVYLSCDDHHLVSRASDTPFYEKPSAERMVTPFNRRGKKIVGWNRFLANIIAATISCVKHIRLTCKLFLDALRAISNFSFSELLLMPKAHMSKLFLHISKQTFADF